MTAPLTFGSLFSGIGGLDLGLEWAGLRLAWQCESDAYCREVLAKRWPGVPCYPDARCLPYDVPAVDLLCGGFPCQPVSLAGPQLGTADERWLWPDFARALRLLRPRYALLENVPGLTIRGMGDVLGPWPRSGTLRSGAAYPQPPWVRLISAGASSYWPTPVARDDGKTPEAHMAMKARMPGTPRQRPTSLTVMVKGVQRGLWPTPKSTFSGPDYARAMREDSGGDDLATAVARTLWPTPQAADASGGRVDATLGGTRPSGSKRAVTLGTAAKLWPTPTVEGNRNRASYPGKSGDGLQTAVGGSLNPDWVEWLMGFPIGWTDLKR